MLYIAGKSVLHSQDYVFFFEKLRNNVFFETAI